MKDRIGEAILWYAKLLHQNGLVSSSDGNISARLSAGGFMVTPTAVPKRELFQNYLVELDAKGRPVLGKPSSEWKLHYEIYKKRKDVSAIAHAHPPFAIALSMLGKSLEDCPLSEVIITLGSVKLVPYEEPGSVELALKAAKALGKAGKAMILSNHGALTVGKDVRSAYYRMEALEHASKIYYHALLLGKPKPFSKAVKKRLDQIAKIYNKE